MKTTLLIMAAGIGSRFGGGIKQLEPVDAQHHIIMDYSIHDAIEAGFNKVVFIIRKDIEHEFKEVIGDRIEAICKAHDVTVDYAFQDINDIPGTLPEGRTKPWGTGQAVLAAKDALDTLSKQVDEAVKNGAKLHLGGKAVAREGNFFEPTILTGITRDNPAYFEEFFGPVAQIYVVKNDEEAIALANDSHYGLGGAVFSQDIERAKRMASAIETGMVYINWLTDTAPELPFGGVKRSGYGRELSDLGIKEFVNQKLVVVRR